MPSTFRGAVMRPPFATTTSAAADPILFVSAPATTDQTCSTTNLSCTITKKKKTASSLVDSLTYSEQDDDDDRRQDDDADDEMMTLDTSSLSYDLFSYDTTTDHHDDDEYDEDDSDEEPLAGEAMDDPDDHAADDDDYDISGSSPSAVFSSLISSFYHSQTTAAEKEENERTLGPVVQLRFPKIDKNGHIAPFEEFAFNVERLWSTIVPQLEAGKAPTDIWVDLPPATTTAGAASGLPQAESRRLSAQVWMGSLLPISTMLFEVFFAKGKNRDRAAAVRAHQVQLLRELDQQHLYQKVQYWIADIVELEAVEGCDIGPDMAAVLADAMNPYYFTDAELEFLDNFWLIDNDDNSNSDDDGIVITMCDLFHTETQVLDVLVCRYDSRRTFSQLLMRLFDLPSDYYRCPLFQQQRVAWIAAAEHSGKDSCCCRLLPMVFQKSARAYVESQQV
jgi:hypothetical protein